MRAGRSPQSGSASVLLLGIGLALLTIALGGQSIGAAAVARHRAGLAADLGALAGALHVPEGTVVACARARSIVTANGGRLVGCTVTGADVVTVVQVKPSGTAVRVGLAEARAKAGPVNRPP
jgi:secretion/DNA translocation related TadE-like protein